MLKAIFFDFDGTLADTAPGIVLTMQKAFQQMGLPIPSDSDVRQTIGLPLLEAVRRLGHFSLAQAEQGVEVYRQLFPIYEVGHVSIFPEVLSTLKILHSKGLRHAICTSRTGVTLDLIMQRFGLAPYFETKLTCNDGCAPKPAPDMVLALLDRMGLKADEVLVVGDTTFDIEMGNRAGCRTVAVTYGNHSRQQLSAAQPTHIIDHFGQLADYVDRHSVFHFQQFAIRQSHAAMKVGTDSDLLGALCAGGGAILDIGTGTGVLSLMLAQRFAEAKITAIEIDENAVLDAQYNFEQSKWADRIALYHISLQDYLTADPLPQFDAVVCNPPYFDRSLECPDQGRSRARHTSSLPFPVLIRGAYQLLLSDGLFSVCIPPEVLKDFDTQCRAAGFALYHKYIIKTIPEKGPKRYVLIYKKGAVEHPQEQVCCMRNADRTRSDWYLALMKDFLICGKL